VLSWRHQSCIAHGAKDFAVIRSVLSTARKQGWSMLQTLTDEPARLLADIRVA
jgi:transposase